MNCCSFSLSLHFSYPPFHPHPFPRRSVLYLCRTSQWLQCYIQTDSWIYSMHMQCLHARSWNEYVQLMMRRAGVCTTPPQWRPSFIVVFRLTQIIVSHFFFSRSFVFVSAAIFTTSNSIRVLMSTISISENGFFQHSFHFIFDVNVVHRFINVQFIMEIPMSISNSVTYSNKIKWKFKKTVSINRCDGLEKTTELKLLRKKLEWNKFGARFKMKKVKMKTI